MISIKNSRSEPMGFSRFTDQIAVSDKYVAVRTSTEIDPFIAIFEKETGFEIGKIFNPDGPGHREDGFGEKMAMSDDYLMIGAPYTTRNSAVPNGEGQYVPIYEYGVVFIVDLKKMKVINTLSLLHKPAASIEFCWFGFDLAISGNYAVVSADRYSDESDTVLYAKSGLVCMYDTRTWQLIREIRDPSKAANQRFGAVLAINDTQLIVAPDTNTGHSIRVFDLETGSVTKSFFVKQGAIYKGKYIAVDNNRVAFSYENSISGGTGVMAYNLTSGSFLYTIASEGETLLIGRSLVFLNGHLLCSFFKKTVTAEKTILHSVVRIYNASLGTFEREISGDLTFLTRESESANYTAADRFGEKLYADASAFYTISKGFDGYVTPYPLTDNTQEYADKFINFVPKIERRNVDTGLTISTILYPYGTRYDTRWNEFGLGLSVSDKYLAIGSADNTKNIYRDNAKNFQGRVYVFDRKTNAFLFEFENPRKVDEEQNPTVPYLNCRFGEKLFFMQMTNGEISTDFFVVSSDDDNHKTTFVAASFSNGVLDSSIPVPNLFSESIIPLGSLGSTRVASLARISDRVVSIETLPDISIEGLSGAQPGAAMYMSLPANSGPVYTGIFINPGANPSKFGSAVTACGLNFMAVGDHAHNDGDNTTGCVYVIETGSGGIGSHIRIDGPISQSGIEGTSGFGSVLVSNGELLAIGAPGVRVYDPYVTMEDIRTFKDSLDVYGAPGSVSIYQVGPWNKVRTIIDPDFEELQKSGIEPGDCSAFGFSIEILGNIIAIGAPAKIVNSRKYAGAVYIFEVNSGKLIQKIDSPETENYLGSRFGHAIQIVNDGIYISAPGASTEHGRFAGAVYFYKKVSDSLAGRPYVDKTFEASVALTRLLSPLEISTMKSEITNLLKNVTDLFGANMKKASLVIHKNQVLRDECQELQPDWDVFYSYARAAAELASGIDLLTTKYKSETGQDINFYDLVNTTNFSLLAKDMTAEILGVGEIAKTASLESKKIAAEMLGFENFEMAVENILLTAELSKNKMVALLRDLKNRENQCNSSLDTVVGAMYILEKTIDGVTTATLANMTSKEREAYLNERYY